MPEDKLAFYKERDPVDRARSALKEMTTIADAEITAIEAEIAAEFAAAVEFSVASPEVSAESFAAFAANY
jgi:pyruvate dehydrogenase E1 component alpha subunit